LDKMGEKTLLSSLRLKEKIKSIARVFVFTSVLILLIFNLVYLKYRIETINPFSYALGKETKETFLKRHLLHYTAVKFINENLSENAKVFTMFLGRRGYYLNRDYKNEPSFGMNTIGKMVNNSESEEKFVRYIRSMNVTHILMRTDLFEKFLHDNFSKKEIERFLNLIHKKWTKLYENKGYAVWDMQTKVQ